jgi:hypothetical protein
MTDCAQSARSREFAKRPTPIIGAMRGMASGPRRPGKSVRHRSSKLYWRALTWCPYEYDTASASHWRSASGRRWPGPRARTANMRSAACSGSDASVCQDPVARSPRQLPGSLRKAVPRILRLPTRRCRHRRRFNSRLTSLVTKIPYLPPKRPRRGPRPTAVPSHHMSAPETVRIAR